MKAKHKSLLLLISTLLTGIIIGMLLSGWMVKQRISSMRKTMEKPSHFMERIESRTDLSREKLKAIEPVLDSHFERMKEIRQTMRYGMRIEKDSLARALSTHLTDEEVDQFFKQMWMKGEGRGRMRHDRRPPPDRRGPPHQ